MNRSVRLSGKHQEQCLIVFASLGQHNVRDAGSGIAVAETGHAGGTYCFVIPTLGLGLVSAIVGSDAVSPALIGTPRGGWPTPLSGAALTDPQR